MEPPAHLSPSPSDYSGDEAEEGYSTGSLADVCFSIFDDLLANLTHDLVLEHHRSEKLLRTEQQQHLAHLAATNAAATVINGTSQPPEDTTTPRMPPSNPLATVPTEILCLRCHLPRATSETPSSGSAGKKFCAKLPFHNVGGHDIYGNPFPNSNGNGTKKSKAGASGDSPNDLPAGTKLGKNSGIAYFECTSCNSNKIASHRYAAHLEKCLGISGRKSSRAAMQKMNNSSNGNGSGSGSPMLAAVDKAASRKPTPDTPTVEDAPALPTPVPAAAVAPAPTPKKKKKPSAPVIAPKDPTPVPAGPTSAPAPSTAGPQKKRKRKLEPTDAADSDAPIASSKPKKQKLAASTAPAPAVADGKKNALSKFKSKVGSPAPSSLGDRHSPIPNSPNMVHPSLPKKPPKPKPQPRGGHGGAENSPKKIKKLSSKPVKLAAGGGGGVAAKKPPTTATSGKGVGGVARKGPPGG
ncbi:hypothetical protein EDC01DRAFT_331229 [Geopyxis carbonaria]|nr:hypothetical protein EDC01DRAFT_331229 [Geopyxis carbonaria]